MISSITKSIKLNIFIYVISFIILLFQLIITLAGFECIISHINEIIVSWSNEVTFIFFIIIYCITLKIFHLYAINIKWTNKTSSVVIAMMIPSCILLGFGIISCRMYKYRQYTDTKWTMLYNENSRKNLKDTTINRNIYQMMTINLYDTSDIIKWAWDTVQNNYECCGSSGLNDWYLMRKNLPNSCCYMGEIFGCNHDEIYENGCKKQIESVLYQQIEYLELLLTFMSTLEIFMFILTVFSVNCYEQEKIKSNSKNQDIISVISRNCLQV